MGICDVSTNSKRELGIRSLSRTCALLSMAAVKFSNTDPAFRDLTISSISCSLSRCDSSTFSFEERHSKFNLVSLAHCSKVANAALSKLKQLRTLVCFQSL